MWHFWPLLTDLSKACNCLPQELLIVKLHTYRFDVKSLNLIHDYLSNRKQRRKIGGPYILWREQLGFHRDQFWDHYCSIFLFVIYSEVRIQQVTRRYYTLQCKFISELEETYSILFKWFNNNYVKVNNGKSHLLMTGNKASANNDNNLNQSEDIHELPGKNIDLKLTFEKHVNKLCKKTNQKLNTLVRISNYMAFD